jgi:hypothetical protein
MMVRLRENTQQHLTRHAVTALPVCAALPAAAIWTYVAIMIVAKGKETAP